MSAPPAPSFFAGTGAVARLTFLRTLRGRKLRVAVVATVVVLLFPALVALLEDDADVASIVSNGIDWGFFRLLSLLLPVLFTSGAIGEEVEGRTLHFLSMRPVSRSSIAIGKYLVGAGASLAVLWAGLVLLHVVGYATSPTLMIDNLGATARAGGAASLLVIAYSGICLFWGALVPEAAGMISVLWLLFFEVFLGLAPSMLRLPSLSHYARLLGALEPAGLDLFVPEIPLWVCAVVIVSAWAIFTLLGVLIVQLSELRFGKA
jgi:ABC-type transport system involved in multi-copper enzyme maturation permease subunit